jgi:putative thioredoxin
MRTLATLALALVLITGIAGSSRDDAQASRSVITIVAFTAKWCGICKALDPILERAVEDAGGRVEFVEVDIDEDPLVADEFGVLFVPMVFAMRDGETIEWFIGEADYRQVAAFINRVTSV